MHIIDLDPNLERDLKVTKYISINEEASGILMMSIEPQVDKQYAHLAVLTSAMFPGSENAHTESIIQRTKDALIMMSAVTSNDEGEHFDASKIPA